jgi:hypothetical protein
MSYELDHLFFHLSNNTCILLHAKQPATDESWDNYLKEMARHSFTGAPQILVFSDGSGPTPAQRQRLMQSTSKIGYLCAVVGEAAITRFIVASLALANPHTRSFYTNELPQALAYLQLTESEAKLHELLKQLSAQLPNLALAKALHASSSPHA